MTLNLCKEDLPKKTGSKKVRRNTKKTKAIKKAVRKVSRPRAKKVVKKESEKVLKEESDSEPIVRVLVPYERH